MLTSVSCETGERNWTDGFKFNVNNKCDGRRSEMERSVLETLWKWRPVEQTRSRMCPRLWVGKLMCWVKLKQFSRSGKSIASLHSGESMWLKSQRSKTDGEIEDSAVMNSERSGMNDGFGGAVDD